VCPWRYFYRNLIRAPEALNKHIMYGSAVHEALKAFFDTLKEKSSLSKKYLVEKFALFLNHQPLSEKDYYEMLQRGKTSLSSYYDNYIDEWKKKKNILNEFKVKGIELGENILLTGKLDKIEILDSAYHVNVVDYKTGKPKSRKEIEGKTKNSTGDYKRQLIFYNILLNNYQNRKFKMVSGEIDFVEPDERGNFKKEFFEITEKEIKEVEEQIKKTAEEILNLSFWNKFCDDPKCPYCKLRRMREN